MIDRLVLKGRELEPLASFSAFVVFVLVLAPIVLSVIFPNPSDGTLSMVGFMGIVLAFVSITFRGFSYSSLSTFSLSLYVLATRISWFQDRIYLLILLSGVLVLLLFIRNEFGYRPIQRSCTQTDGGISGNYGRLSRSMPDDGLAEALNRLGVSDQGVVEVTIQRQCRKARPCRKSHLCTSCHQINLRKI